MNLNSFLRFLVMQSVALLTNFQYAQAFSLDEKSKSIITIPFEPGKRYATVSVVNFAGSLPTYKSFICKHFTFVAFVQQKAEALFVGDEVLSFAKQNQQEETLKASLFKAKGLFVTQNLERNFEGLLSKIEALLSPLAFSLLLFLMLAYWSQAAFFGQEKYKTFNNVIFFLALASLTLLLSVRWIISRHFPLSNLYESLVFLSLCFLSLKAIFLPRRKVLQKDKSKALKPVLQDVSFNGLGDTNPLAIEKKADFLGLGLGVILSPMALLTFGFAFLSLPKEMQQSTALVPALQSNWLMMHVTVMVLSYAALISGSILAIAFLILSFFQSPYPDDEPIFFGEGNAKQEVAPGVQTLATKVEYSSLAVRLDNYSYRILALGFPLLTIGILSGAVWANEAWGSYWSWDPKETWALITWLVFAIYLHTRITKGWSGKKPALVASAGFFMVWFCYLGVNLLGTGLHSYGWFTN